MAKKKTNKKQPWSNSLEYRESLYKGVNPSADFDPISLGTQLVGYLGGFRTGQGMPEDEARWAAYLGLPYDKTYAPDSKIRFEGDENYPDRQYQGLSKRAKEEVRKDIIPKARRIKNKYNKEWIQVLDTKPNSEYNDATIYHNRQNYLGDLGKFGIREVGNSGIYEVGDKYDFPALIPIPNRNEGTELMVRDTIWSDRANPKLYEEELLRRSNKHSLGGLFSKLGSWNQSATEGLFKHKDPTMGGLTKFGQFAKGFGINSGNIGGIANTAATAIGGLLAGKNKTGVGSAMQTVGSLASNIPGVGGLIGAGVNLAGGLVNAAFGSNLNQEFIDQTEQAAKQQANYVSSASTNSQLMSDYANMSLLSDVNKDDVGSDGWFSNKASDETDRLNKLNEEANMKALASLSNTADNIDKQNDLGLMVNYTAYGGPLDTRMELLRKLEEKRKKRGNYGGGEFGGAGASSLFLESPDDFTLVKDTIWVPYRETFNDAFGRARAAGLDEFMFDNKAYTTELGDNPDNNKVGEERAIEGLLPIERTRQIKNKKAEGGPLEELTNSYINPKSTSGILGKGVIQLLDPTGVSSYPDVYASGKELWNDFSLDNTIDFGIDLIGALPLIGKVTAPFKAAKMAKMLARVGDVNAIVKSIGKANEVNKIIDTFPELLPITRKAAEKVQDLTTKVIVDPLFNYYSAINKTDKVKDYIKANAAVNAVNIANNTSDVGDIIKNFINKKAKGGPLKDSEYYSIMEKVAKDNYKNWGFDNEDEALAHALNDNTYNYRGYYNKYPKSKANADTHWTDEFKTVHHPTFSNESVYSGKVSQYNPEGLIGGSWDGETFIPADWQNKKAEGGELFTNGVTTIDNGGTHEQNKYEGVQMGVDPQGIPNLVEEGEVIFNDYVFSNRLRVPKEVRQKYKLRGVTFADAAKQLQKESEERPNDSIAKNTLNSIMSELTQVQEEIRMKKNSNKYAKGGKLGRVYEGEGEDANWLYKPVTPGFIPSKDDILASMESMYPSLLGESTLPIASKIEGSTSFKDQLGIKGEEQSSKVAPMKTHWLRYTPLIGSSMAVMNDLFGGNEPDYSNASMFERAIEGTNRPVTFTPLFDYMAYKPVDIERYKNRLDANAAASRRAIRNTSGGNRAAYLTGLLSSDYNYGNQLGELMGNIEGINYSRYKDMKAYNKATNLANAEMAMKADMANAEQGMQRARMYGSLAEYRDKILAANRAEKSANLTNFIQGLGDLGTELTDKDKLRWLADRGVLTYNPSGDYTGSKTSKKKGKKKKYGGKLNKKRGGFTV